MTVSRLAYIGKIFAEEGLGYLMGKASDSAQPGESKVGAAETAARLRRALERLGPTFVKFGQLLATCLLPTSHRQKIAAAPNSGGV